MHFNRLPSRIFIFYDDMDIDIFPCFLNRSLIEEIKV